MDAVATKLEKVSLTDLIMNKKNWRRHDRDQRKMFQNAVSEAGFITPIIWNRSTGNILDGHLRASEAKTRGDSSIDAIVIEVPQEQEDKILALLDKVSGMAKIDKDKYNALVSSIIFNQKDLEDMLKDGKNKLKDLQAAEFEITQEMLLKHNYLILVFKDEINFNTAKAEFGIDYRIDRYNGQKGISLAADGDEYICRIKK